MNNCLKYHRALRIISYSNYLECSNFTQRRKEKYKGTKPPFRNTLSIFTTLFIINYSLFFIIYSLSIIIYSLQRNIHISIPALLNASAKQATAADSYSSIHLAVCLIARHKIYPEDL